MIRVLKKLSIIAAGCICLLLSIQQLNAALIAPPHVTQDWQEITSVKWSTDKVNWGIAAVNVGDTVYFQFQITKDFDGEHYQDLLKAWIDWNGDSSVNQSEHIYFSSSTVHATTYSVELDKYLDGSTKGTDLVPNKIVTFTSSGITFDSEGTFDMLVRTTCTADVYREATGGTLPSADWAKQWSKDDAWYNNAFSPTDDRYGQGDSKLYQITVVQGPSVVPEPSTVLLLISGLIGIAGIARRKK